MEEESGFDFAGVKAVRALLFAYTFKRAAGRTEE